MFCFTARVKSLCTGTESLPLAVISGRQPGERYRKSSSPDSIFRGHWRVGER